MVLSVLKKWRTFMRRPAVSIPVSAAACLCMPFIFSCLCELIRINSVSATLAYVLERPLLLALGAVFTTLLYAFITVVTARPWIANLLVGGVLLFGGWVNLQKMIWRGDNLVPRDLLLIPTAAGVARDMTFTLQWGALCALAVLALSTLALCLVRLPFGRAARARWLRAGLAVLLLGAMPLYLGTVIYNKDVMDSRGFSRSWMGLPRTYYENSFVTSFLYMSGDAFNKQPPPADYSRETVEAAVALLNARPDAAARRCDVIVVLLESYFELFNYEDAVLGQPLGENFARLAAEGVSGQMLSVGYGGNTANVEFSVLTGYQTAWLPTGSIPYIEFIQPDFLCYPQFLKAAGYQTMALHASDAVHYNRLSTYPQMGIDRFDDQGTFDAGDYLGRYVTDAATLDHALAMYTQAAQTGPVFLHVVTMQGHGPNDATKYPAGYLMEASLPGADEAANISLAALATSLRDTDAAVGAFVDALREVDRDVVVLFFGDHQAGVMDQNNEDLLNSMPGYAALSAQDQRLYSHLTPFLMWANFDAGVAGTDAGLLPCHMLLPVLLQSYDVVRPAWMDWLAAAGDALQPWYVEMYYSDMTAALSQMDADQQAVYRAEQLLQYDLMFGKQYAAAALYGEAMQAQADGS